MVGFPSIVSLVLAEIFFKHVKGDRNDGFGPFNMWVRGAQIPSEPVTLFIAPNIFVIATEKIVNIALNQFNAFTHVNE